MFAVVADTQEALGSNPWATASTYCLVAKSSAAVGSWVTVTVVKPPKVRLDAPKAIAVVPTVTEELVRLALAILVSVLVAPLIDLLVKVSVVLRATSVSVPDGMVIVPLFEIDEIIGSKNVPPVTVLPVKVSAAGSDNTTVVVPVAVISFAVPDTDATAPMPLGVIVEFAAAVSWP